MNVRISSQARAGGLLRGVLAWALCGAMLVVAGCGGGGGSGGGGSATVPAAPDGLSVSAGSGQVTVGWAAVNGATSYNVYLSTQTGVTKTNYTQRQTGVSSPYAFTGLTNGTTYYLVVTAVNAKGESAVSSEVNATPTASTGQLPAAPTGVSASAANAKVTVTWTAVSGAASYNVYLSTQTGVTKSNYTQRQTGVSSPYAFTGLTNGTTYYLVVTAVNANGESAESSEVNGTPSATTAQPPAAPTGVSASPADAKVTVTWTAVSGATSYNVYMSTQTGVTKSSYTQRQTGVSSPYAFTGLTNGTTYYFVVTAVNANGESAESSEVNGAPAAMDPVTLAQKMVVGGWAFEGTFCASFPDPYMTLSAFFCPAGRLKGIETGYGSGLGGLNGVDYLAEGTWAANRYAPAPNDAYPRVDLNYTTTVNYGGTIDSGPGTLDASNSGLMLYDAQSDRLVYRYNGCYFAMKRLADGSNADVDDSYCGSTVSTTNQCGTDADCGRCWYCDKSGSSNICRYGGEGPYGCYRGWQP